MWVVKIFGGEFCVFYIKKCGIVFKCGDCGIKFFGVSFV